MNPISIRNRSPEQSSAIQRQMKAAKMRALFDDVEAQLTDPVLIEMTRFMRDTVMGSPEFAEEGERPLSPRGAFLMERIQDARSARLQLRSNFVFMAEDASYRQELLDAGLVERTPYRDGRVSYRLTSAGRAWRNS